MTALTLSASAQGHRRSQDRYPEDRPWLGEATSVIEFLRPLRAVLDRPDVLEVCLNQPGVLMIESTRGWEAIAAPEMDLPRCLALATALATFSNQQISQERPLLAAALPTGERVQFVVPPAVPRDTVSITIRKPSLVVKGLDDFEREGLFERTAGEVSVGALPHERELLAMKQQRRYADFLRLAVETHQTIIVSGKTGSGKTTFMKGLI